MDLKRFFSSEIIDNKKIILRDNEFYHAVKVTRHKIGYKLIVCDNGNVDYYCTVTDIGKDYLIAEIDEIRFNPVENKISVNLYIGNNKDLDEVVQKSVELGVNNIIPFNSAHCNVKSINKERLEKIVLESSKQCGRSKLAKVGDLVDFTHALDSVKNTNVFFFYEHERTNKISNAILKNDKDISIFIGPEGGFSEEEITMVKEQSYPTFTLGKCILRVSTAVVAACTLINDRMDVDE